MGYSRAGSKKGKGVKSKKYFFYNFSFFSKKSQEHYYFKEKNLYESKKPTEHFKLWNTKIQLQFNFFFTVPEKNLLSR